MFCDKAPNHLYNVFDKKRAMTEEYISKSEKKRRFRREEQVAEEISRFSEKDLKKFPVSDSLKEEIRNCRGLKAGSLKRQIKYLAKVMRHDDVEQIFSYLEDRKGSSLKSNRLHHEAEHYRDIIVNEAMEDQKECLKNSVVWAEDWYSEEIEVVEGRLPWVNIGDIRRAVFLYVRTKKHTHYKELFKIMKAGLEREEREKKVAE